MYRVRSYINNGWADNIINPDKAQDSENSPPTTSVQPQQGSTIVWKNVKKAYSSKDEVPSFSTGQMVSYFVSRTVCDGLPAGDFNAMNKKAKSLFNCGHIQNIEVGCTDSCLWLRADCLPEMKKDTVYKILMSLSNKTYDIISAKCGCKAGKGPKASCKHVGALCYAYAEFCETGRLTDFITCTQKLQEWNVPRPRKVDVIPVIELSSRKEQILKKKSRSHPVPSQYDPRPASMQTYDSSLTEKLRVDLLDANPSCALLQLLVPPVSVALHDHNYLCTNGLSTSNHTISSVSDQECDSEFPSIVETHQDPVSIKKSMNVTLEQRSRIEKETRSQSKSFQWFAVRTRRITGSTCGKILNQIKKTDPLLKSILYPKRLDPLPLPMKWGIENECHACEEYTQYMKTNGHNLETRKCGFIVHPTMGWLGASPDAFVTDNSEPVFRNGIAEFKCPFSKKDVSPVDACTDQRFYCSLDDNKMHLKRNHIYLLSPSSTATFCEHGHVSLV